MKAVFLRRQADAWASGALSGAESAANQRSSSSNPNHPSYLLALKNGCQAGATDAYSHHDSRDQAKVGAKQIGGNDLPLKRVPVGCLVFDQTQQAFTSACQLTNVTGPVSGLAIAG